MAYNSQDERLLVKGNERITRQLKVGKEIFADCDINAACDVNVTGSLNTDKICSAGNLDISASCVNVNATSLETNAVTCIKNDLNVKCTVDTCNLKVNGTVKNRLEVEGDIRGQQDIIAECDLVVHGNLLVDGNVTASTETQVATTGDYLVTRENNNNALTSTEYSGLAVNNYSNGKMATLTSDYCGTWRVSDSATNTGTTYTNVSEFNGQFYDHLTQTTTSGPTGVMTDVNAIELSNVVLYNGSYYHKEGEDWFGPISVVNGIFDLGSLILDSATITALEALTAYELIYYNTVKDNHINVSQNQPLLTRAEESSLQNNDILVWDNTNKKAVPMTRPTVSGSNLTATIDGATSCVTYAWTTGITATNSICFNGCTYAQAKADILTGNAASATNATNFNGYTYTQACTDIRSGLTSCVGTVTIADRAAANSDAPIALRTSATTVGESIACPLTFNTCTGVLKATTFCGLYSAVCCNGVGTDTWGNLKHMSPNGTDTWGIYSNDCTAALNVRLESGDVCIRRALCAYCCVQAPLVCANYCIVAPIFCGTATNATNATEACSFRKASLSMSNCCWIKVGELTNSVPATTELVLSKDWNYGQPGTSKIVIQSGGSYSCMPRVEESSYNQPLMSCIRFGKQTTDNNCKMSIYLKYNCTCENPIRFSYCSSAGNFIPSFTCVSDTCAGSCACTQTIFLHACGHYINDCQFDTTCVNTTCVVACGMTLSCCNQCGIRLIPITFDSESQGDMLSCIQMVATWLGCKAYPVWGYYNCCKLDYFCKVSEICYNIYSGNSCIGSLYRGSLSPSTDTMVALFARTTSIF